MDISLHAREGEQEFVDLTRSFARKSVLPLFQGDTPDGRLEMVPSIVKKAFEIGLAASPDREMPGYEYGIWGTHARDPDGVRRSAILLSIVAEACAGIAMNLHAQGLASHIVTASGSDRAPTFGRVAVALQEGHTLPGYRALCEPCCHAGESITTRALCTKTGHVISGGKSFVYGMKGVDAFLVFCRVVGEDEKGWGCFLVPADAPGLRVQNIAGRTGIRACELTHLELQDVEVPCEYRLDNGDAFPLVSRALCLHWLGLSAMAAGVASGALNEAREYASSRYQGGAMIDGHPAVKKLLAISEARVEASFALLLQAAGFSAENRDFLRRCAIAKLMTTDWAFSAVTDSLQVFGGYGYMEDYHMEKRLRDMVVLKTTGGSRNHLEIFLFDAGKEVAV